MKEDVHEADQHPSDGILEDVKQALERGELDRARSLIGDIPPPDVAVQTSTIVVRSLAVGDIRAGHLASFVGRQIVVNLLLAVCCGLAAGLLSSLVPGTQMGLLFVVATAASVAIVVAGNERGSLPAARGAACCRRVFYLADRMKQPPEPDVSSPPFPASPTVIVTSS